MILHWFERWFAGRKRYQALFRKLNSLALLGMHYGRGHDVQQSGEKELLQRMRAEGWLGPKAVVWDVGGNTGQYSMQILATTQGNIELHVFEPSPLCHSALMKVGEAAPFFKLHPIGLGNEETHLTLYNAPQGSLQASFVPRATDTFGVGLVPDVTVPVRRLDAYSREQGIVEIDWMKLDVEGFELKVLQGAGEWLDGNRIRAIQFETGPAMIDARTYFYDFFQLLNPHYRVYRLLRDGLHELTAYDERQEVFLVSVHVALSRYGPRMR